jgi:hypothetical protein
MIISFACTQPETFQKSSVAFCDDFIPVQFNDLTICVAPDYYSVDGIRTPLGFSDALHLADSLDLLLPTVEIVNAIYQQAHIKLAPIPMPPTEEMITRAYYIRHHNLIQDQLVDSGFSVTAGMLIAGHKKDVISYDRNSDRVAIYGWHLSDSTVIQPFSTVHRRDYFDYSHGIRLIKKVAMDSAGNEVFLNEIIEGND